VSLLSRLLSLGLKRLAMAPGGVEPPHTDPSADLLDHLDELVDGISLPASELHELPNPLHDSSALGRPGHGGSATASKLEQPFVLKQPQRAQDGVGVDSEDGREVSCRWESLTGLRLSVGYRTPNLGRDLLVEVGSIRPVHLDSNHCTSNTSAIVIDRHG
jgi:hypothetical protein